VSTVALTTVGAILDEGGLGDLLVAGQLSDFKAQVLATSVLCVLLAIVLDLLLVAVQRALTPWTRRAAT
jgi:osmoprotectant transport system permease protein